ncbi:MAG: ThuA domain-containing protein [Verrucomicrobia bacterium]|nr:ThuA domain-containing protein [Verrucomicrobiota bacterium]
MRRLLIAIASFAIITSVHAAKINVLLITGDDVKSHNWRETAPETKKILESSGKFAVTVVEGAKALDDADALKKCDVIYLHLYNATTPTASDAGKANLLNAVKGGKGFVVAHLASASFKEWEEFKKLCGRCWVMKTSGHGPRSVFKVNIKEKNNPIMKGLKDFEQDDELYAKLQGDAPIRVLATADSDWSNKTEPMVFTLNYGKGRVFHHTFGHDVKSLSTPEVRKLIERGAEWAATGSVQPGK